MISSSLFFGNFIDKLEWEQSYATLNGIRVVDTTKRSSKICTQKFNVDFPNELNFFCKTCKITQPSKLELTLFKYDEGDFFAQHVNRQRSENHAYTLLILPPCKSDTQNWFQGGNLIIGSTVITCSSITAYTYLIFNIDILHELEPILKGTRYVFKSQLDVTDKSVIRNAFPFTKPIYHDFNIDFTSMPQITFLHNGDLTSKVNSKPIDIDFTPNETKTEPPKSKTILNILHDLISPNPAEQWTSDYDTGYYSQPDYRKGLYLRNKINARMGEPTMKD